MNPDGALNSDKGKKAPYVLMITEKTLLDLAWPVFSCLFASGALSRTASGAAILPGMEATRQGLLPVFQSDAIIRLRDCNDARLARPRSFMNERLNASRAQAPSHRRQHCFFQVSKTGAKRCSARASSQRP